MEYQTRGVEEYQARVVQMRLEYRARVVQMRLEYRARVVQIEAGVPSQGSADLDEAGVPSQGSADVENQTR